MASWGLPVRNSLGGGVFVRCKGEEKLFAFNDSIRYCTDRRSKRRIGVFWLFADRSNQLNMYGKHISITVGRGTSHVHVEGLTARR